MTDTMLAALETQRQAFGRDPCPSLGQRQDRLRRLETLVRHNREALHRALSADFGSRARPETMLAEILPVLDAIAYTSGRLARWMRPQTRRVGARLWPGRAWILTQPLGCIGIISPWNYPILLSLLPALDGLAAGNRVLLKPSEHTPTCSALLARLIGASFDPAEFAALTGDADTGRRFCALPFDHLLFTGSTGVGRSVLQAAAANMVPVTLELGGKSPAILCADAVATPQALARTAHSLAVGKFFNAGQTCLAPDYVLTPRAHLAETAEALRTAATRLYPSIADNPDYTALIADAHRRRLRALIDDASPGCAAILRHPEDTAEMQPSLESQRKLAPTILCAPDPGCRAMEEEIFGPILPVLPYDSLDAAIGFINGRPVPLALYCYSHDPAVQRLVLARTRSGGATLNGTLLHGAMPSLPFGGLGQSGTGAYHGHAGFLRFSHQRSVYRPGRFSGFTWMSPPHGQTSRRMIRLMLGKSS